MIDTFGIGEAEQKEVVDKICLLTCLLTAEQKEQVVVTLWDTCLLTAEQKEQVVVTLWDWWTARNKVNAGEQRKSTEEVCRLIQKHCREFKSEQRQAMIAAQQDFKWDRPPLGYVKVNFDASFITEIRDGAYGYVIRLDTGDFIAAAAGNYPI
jgi:hypothetical protein